MKKSVKVSKNVIKKAITFEYYKEWLLSGKDQMRNISIRSRDHEIYSMKMNKIAISANDDKRIICKDKMPTKELR